VGVWRDNHVNVAKPWKGLALEASTGEAAAGRLSELSGRVAARKTAGTARLALQ
jgi:hypothetical protein